MIKVKVHIDINLLLRSCTVGELQSLASEAKRFHDMVAKVGPLTQEEIGLLKSRNTMEGKIGVVKKVRERTGAGLFEAKTAVECTCNELGVPCFVD